ncbi:MAG TPA: carboxypeptidase-like regulatory domain-containing protein [Methanocella sp.]|nr:carboxypeptidase-like regulatory domain-containing protein [Methanocella sp.]
MPSIETRMLLACLLISPLVIISYLQAAAPQAAAEASNTAEGSINGTVYDSTHNLVPGADVYLQVRGGRILELTSTDDNATYSFSNLTPGNYSIIVQIEGYMWSRNLNVIEGKNNIPDIVMPDYVHYPIVTPQPTQKNEMPTSARGNASRGNASPTEMATSVPAQKNVTSNGTINGTGGTIAASQTGNETSYSNTSATTNNSTSGAGGGGIGDIIGGIINFIKSIFGL